MNCRHTQPQTVPSIETLEPRLLLSAHSHAALLPSALTDSHPAAAVLGDVTSSVGAAQGLTTGDHGSSSAAKKPPSPPPPESQPPSITPPSFLPGPDAYTAVSTVTGSIISTASGQVLLVRGSNTADTVTVSQTSSGLSLTTAAGSTTFTGAFAGVAIYGFAGADTLRLTNTVTVTSVIYGGSGNDQIFSAGTGVDYEYGQDGDDLLVSVGGKADVVRGGEGLDGLWVDSTDLMPDVDAAETAGTAVHTISAFYQPTRKSSVSLEIAGQDLADPSTSYRYYSFSSVPLWVDGPEYNDVVQGYLGDCYYLAALGSLADTHPALMSQMIAPMGDGSYAVRFYQAGTPVYVRVDSQLPGTRTGGLIYAQLTPDGELWVALTEKAYAQFHGGKNSYQALSGGYVDVSYTELTGQPSSWWSTTHWATGDVLGQFIEDELAKGFTLAGGTSTSAKTPIVGNHAYEILGVSKTADGSWSVTVYNPWGIDGGIWDSNPNDGVLMISMDIFRQNYDTVYESYA